MDKKYLTINQTAEYLQLNPQTIYEYVRAGRIPASRLGRVWRIKKEDVDEFMEAQKKQQNLVLSRK